jgi:hypothetical protein
METGRKEKHMVNTEKVSEINAKQDKIVKSLTLPHLKNEDVRKNLPNINVMNTQLMTKSVEYKSPNYNNLTKEQSLIVQKENVDNYYRQIMNNIVIGAKSIFLVCRDLVDAEKNLPTEEFEILKDVLPISESTITKYLKVGKSTTCRKLFELNKLPESWTTMYKISKITDSKDRQKIESKVDINTTAKDIDVLMHVMKKELKPLWTYTALDSPRDFLKVAVEGDTKIADIDSNAMKLIASRVEKVVEDSIKELKNDNLKYNVSEDEKPIVAEVVTNKTFIQNIEDKVLKYFKKLKGKSTQKEYKTAFLAKKLDIENPVFAKLGS